jgi:metal-responsive CopG/Arc/MetJ family transcriptional regulator
MQLMHTERTKGRPPIAGKAMATVQIRMPERMLEEIEAIQAERLDGADRSQIVRELITEGIKQRRRK